MTATIGEATTAPPSGAHDEQVNILLVDDRAENLLALEAILEPLGVLVTDRMADVSVSCARTRVMKH